MDEERDARVERPIAEIGHEGLHRLCREFTKQKGKGKTKKNGHRNVTEMQSFKKNETSK